MTRYVDPFFGNGETNLPEPNGLPAKWFFPKAQTGNTHPGASLPFGLLSVCPYSGAYPTGYGLNKPNSCGKPPKAYDKYKASGFTHFHPSGTGAIGCYYNYFKVVPFVGDFRGVDKLWRLSKETARPGSYSCMLGEEGIRAELTVSRRVAMHRYDFPGSGQSGIAVDVLNGGIDFDGRRSIPEKGQIRRISAERAAGYVVMEGVPIYVCIEMENAEGSTLWADGNQISSREISFSDGEGRPGTAGVIFRPNPSTEREIELRLGFSFQDIDRAEQSLQEVKDRTFDQVQREAEAEWNRHLERIEVEGGTETTREVLYTSLYHSLLKPAFLPGESPFGRGECFTDFATLWDQYKTHLPLVFTLYPRRSVPIINSLLNIGECSGDFPICVLISRDFDKCRQQARGLVQHVLADAFNRGVDEVDWVEALSMMVDDILREENQDFLKHGSTGRLTHTLDLAEACWCTGQVAEGLGRGDIADTMSELAENWRNAYDPGTGILRSSEYYEGGAWNYSFRLLHDMKSRIGLVGREQFVTQLDKFFGYGEPSVKQPRDPHDGEYIQRGLKLNRFEGFNNESDMETPFAYIYAGRHDRTAEVVRSSMKSSFSTGRGGLPGNNDSGGLTSTFIWNAIGLFPVVGQREILVGSPAFDSVVLKTDDWKFAIIAKNNSEQNVYVGGAELNGKRLNRPFIPLEDFRDGGELRLEMQAEPMKW